MSLSVLLLMVLFPCHSSFQLEILMASSYLSPNPILSFTRFRYQQKATHTIFKGTKVGKSLLIRHRCHRSNMSADIMRFPSNCETITQPTNKSLQGIRDAHQTVTILQRGPHHIVALKPPSVVCHHSDWTGSRSKGKTGQQTEIPMLQRVRDAIHDVVSRDFHQENPDKLEKKKINLVHRLDRGASGALLFAYANDDDAGNKHKGHTASLIEAMASPDCTKTYVALVRGEGIQHGIDFKKMGWFEVTRPIKNEKGEEKNATTWFRFIAGQPESVTDKIDRPRMSLVLARPMQGRWHQIRKHLNGISHPILGDSTHGSSKVNRQWKEQRNLPPERVCLHLARLQLPATTAVPEGMDVSCPIYYDMLEMLRLYAPEVLEQALPVLKEEGITVHASENYERGYYTTPNDVLYSTRETSEKVHVIQQGEHYVIVSKPASVVVHHSSWTRLESDLNHTTPMLQRVRDTTGRHVNLIHRLDRGASGCLLFSFAQNDSQSKSCPVTKALIHAMQHPEASKTYLALCDGDGTWNGIDFRQKGWFTFDNPVKDEWGRVVQDCTTEICFVSSTTLPPTSPDDLNNMEGRKVSMILARPRTGRWHQIRQHLSCGRIGHAILGDTSHGKSRTNRIWQEHRHLLKERCILHLFRIQLPATDYSPKIDVTCPLPPDIMTVLDEMPDLLDSAQPVLQREGINIHNS